MGVGGGGGGGWVGWGWGVGGGVGWGWGWGGGAAAGELLLEMQERERGETTKLRRETFEVGTNLSVFLDTSLLCFFPHIQHLQGDPSWGLVFGGRLGGQ